MGESHIVFPKGRLIRKAREAQGVTLADLEEWVSRDQSHLSKIERGVYPPSLKTKVDLANALDQLSLAEILTKEERELLDTASALLLDA